MFAIQVELGKERIRVRSYMNGFLPSYLPAGQKAGKKLVIPGYVFMLTRIPGAEKVPDEEWRIIEAISDPHPSTVSRDWKRITGGPLEGLEIHKVDRRNSAIRIRQKLLGTEREYWLKVEEEPMQDVQPEEEAKQKEKKINKQTEGRDMAEKKTYTNEEIKAALQKAKDVGIHAAGKELNIPWQTILGWEKKENPDRVTVKQAKGAKKAAKAAKTVKEENDTANKETVTVETAPEKKKEKNGKVVETVKTTAPAGDIFLENAVLKERIAILESQVAKLKKALAELM